ncbi:MAG: response regulator transcription factor [Clostridia bacterium]|nr:response regulator transcription factor [Clostridia bacterium]
MAEILLADDDQSILDMLNRYLTFSGHTMILASDGMEARKKLEQCRIDIALLDIMMPGEDGYSLAGAFLERNIPVLFMTAKTALADRVRGLRMGAEDYIVKPFEPEELLARIDVILRRVKSNVFFQGGMLVNYEARTVFLDGEQVPFTAMEFDLLALLTKNAGAALSREKMIAAVWGWDFVGETRTVDVHVQRLRAKLGAETIETVYKYGYRWVGRKNN